MQRTFLGLYRWYVAESQKKRAWNPDLSFDWRSFRPDHSADVWAIIEGFFAVEQYVPDYASKITHLVRQAHGRSYFQLQWGAEETKHSLVWENALIFSRHRTSVWMEEYRHNLLNNEWALPWDDPLHMLVYTVFQERATQLNYRNMGLLARGDHNYPVVDPVLSHLCRALVADEAAHYHFFLAGVRLYLYYFPAETLEAILDVLKHFAMPAQDIIPHWGRVAEAIYRMGIYGPREFRQNVLDVVFRNLSLRDRKAVEAGLLASRLVPDEAGALRNTALWETFDPVQVEAQVLRLNTKIQRYEKQVGRDVIEPWEFIPDPQWPRP